MENDDQDAIMRSIDSSAGDVGESVAAAAVGGEDATDEEESIQFMLSQSGGLESMRSKKEGSFFKTRISKVSDIYSVSITN